MVHEKRTLIFTADGVRIEEERQTPLSDATKTLVVDEVGYEDFPSDSLTIGLTEITPILYDDGGDGLKELRFDITHLERAGTQPDPADRFWEDVYEQTGIQKDDGGITLSSDNNAKENLQAFVEFLLTNGYLTEADLPVESGWKRHLINTEPVDQEGDSMVEPVEVMDEIYMETKYSRDDIRTKIAELAEQFGEQAASPTL